MFSCKRFLTFGMVWSLVFVFALNLHAQGPVSVKVEKNGGKWMLTRGGQPYYVNGAGGDGSLELLKQCGGNSTRTWGVDETTKARLDEAHSQGISVAVGIWLEHERHGFDYSDKAAVDRQADKAMEMIRKYKDHPAILVWGVGNEMEGYEKGDNPNIWSHIEDLCKRIKAEDPNHPTMSVVAEVSDTKIAAIEKHCPSLDIVGINSYGGSSSVMERYQKFGGTKPVIITEFGPVGTWEVGKNEIDAIEEPNSDAKAETYAKAHASFKQSDLCLGSYAFIWGHKQEGTPTWFGMLMPDGKKLASVDAMTKAWTGKAPANLCPVIEKFELEGSKTVNGGDQIRINMKASDPENRILNVSWSFTKDAKQFITGGDLQASPPDYSNMIRRSGESGVTIEMPEMGGLYRAFVVVSDGVGAATANIPVRVKGKDLENPGKKAQLPYVVADEDGGKYEFSPSGWMGNADKINILTNCTKNPKVGKTCIECQYNSTSGWGGVVWLHPESDWGKKPGGVDLTGAEKLSFWVRGESGGEKVKFGFGLLGRNEPYFDTAKKEREVTLDSDWQQITFDLSQLDLRRIKSGFYWSAASGKENLKFYLDRIVFEGTNTTTDSTAGNAATSDDGFKNPGKKVALPYTVADEGNGNYEFSASGWMGNTDAIVVKPDCFDNPKVGKTCTECQFNSTSGWGGVVWLHPENDWGKKPGGVDLSGAKKMSFWVRGKKGGEKVKFGFGLLGKDEPYFDTAKKEREITLTSDWQQVTFDVSESDLRRIKSGFFWSLAAGQENVRFYLDGIVFE